MRQTDGSNGVCSSYIMLCTTVRLQGRYRVKFMVDGEWRLAPDWPMEANEEGETNNILEVL